MKKIFFIAFMSIACIVGDTHAQIDIPLCDHLRTVGDDMSGIGRFKMGYDTLRFYIESCAMQSESWAEFGQIIYDVHYIDTTDQNRWVDAREWLKKVLYYNPDTNYYCFDVTRMLFTFAYFEGRGIDNLGYLAVLKYLHDNHKCLSFIGETYNEIYTQTMDSITSNWRDTVEDSLKTPLDTTLPSIDQLGLGILRGQSGVVSASGTSGSTIEDLSLVENPFHNEAILRYHLNNSAMVHIDIFDALGRRMVGEGEGYKHEGDYQISFDARTWASGTYYLRVSTLSGEVKSLTLKLLR